MLVFLIGFMGCGKTTNGKKLAQRLNYQFYDLDAEVEKQERISIAQIFNSHGEDYFRNIEQQQLFRLSQKSNVIIACGGGTPCFFNNMEYMNKMGLTLYIQMTPEALFSRLKNAKSTRPLLQKMNDEELKSYIKHKLSERENTYLKSKYIVNGINLNIPELADFIKKNT
jgi:shikimate kinase